MEERFWERHFWIWIVGIALAIGIGGMIIFVVIGAAWYAWGAFGALIFVAAVLLAFGWIWDRMHARKYDEELT